MSDTHPPHGTPARRAHGKRPSNNTPGQPRTAARPPHPVLAQLATLYPALFGPQPLPLKRGIFQDLVEAHPAELPADGLKAALSEHTRSGAYLNAVAKGLDRHDLAGQAVEPMATEHVVHALLEVYRRRQNRSAQDLSGQLIERLAAVFEHGGLGREAFAALAPARHPQAQAWFDAALDLAAQKAARTTALRRAYVQSGLGLEAFAAQYGLSTQDARALLAPDSATHPAT